MSRSSNILTPTERELLLARAKAVSKHAYCPYSAFAVGAALLTASRNVYVGCNVENAAYSPCLCAERNAVGAMVASGEREILAIAIYTPTQEVAAPCGVCRQVLNEFSPELWVISVCDSDQELEMQMSELLPEAFGPKNLGRSV
jgi:cytidine deaminase